MALTSLLPLSFKPIVPDGNESINILAYNLIVAVQDIALPIAMAALIYTGYLLITSAGKPEAYKKAKQNLSYIVIGIFLITFAVILVNFTVGVFTKG